MSLSKRLEGLKPQPARVLCLDIETSPALLYSFTLKPDYINPTQIVEPSRVLCFAAKWHGEAGTELWSEWDQGREAMIEAAWQYLNEADVVIGYNHRSFDIPHLQREMVLLGYGPPSPWVDVDLLAEVRRNFKFMSARLGYVVDQLGLDAKMDAGGFDTWRSVLAGERSAQKRMGTYCRGDVEITSSLALYLQNWIRLPHSGLFSGDLTACHNCGSKRLVPDGISRTRVSAWLRLACEDCGAHNRMLDNGQTRRP